MSLEQSSLFDQREGERRRDEAISRAASHAFEGWLDDAYDAVVRCAQSGRTFTTDDVWASMSGEMKTREPRAMGAVMRRAVKAGVIVPTDEWRLSENPDAHRRPKRVWRGL